MLLWTPISESNLIYAEKIVDTKVNKSECMGVYNNVDESIIKKMHIRIDTGLKSRLF